MAMSEPPSVVPLHTFILKVATRCNLNCSYCFVYNLADQSWRTQPGFMSAEVARQTAKRMLEHCEQHEKKNLSLVFHGGEPLLGGLAHLRALKNCIDDVLVTGGIKVRYGIQSNGVLVNEELASWLVAEGVSIGISLDGPPHVNDKFRVDHAGRGSSAAVEVAVRMLTRTAYRSAFAGFLTVIDVRQEPEEVLDYLFSFSPPGIDLLLPLDNHDRKSALMRPDVNDAYGRWLIRAFDYWLATRPDIKIRYFRSILRSLCGGASTVESVGLTPADLVVIEANGDIEAVDSLKATFDGATQLGFNVARDSFDEVLERRTG